MGFFEWLENTGFATWVSESPSLWAYAFVLTLHTIGMSLLVGANAVIDVRLLGLAPDLPLAPLKKLFPVMWIGFWINAASGIALFMAHASEKAAQPVFYIKLGCVAAGMSTIVLLRNRLFRAMDQLDEGPVPTSGRVLAGVSLVMWAGAITAGRLMAYL